MIPGPSQYSERVSNSMTLKLVGHRTVEFETVVNQIRQKLSEIYKTSGDIYLFTSSATGSIEAAISNFIKDDDKVAVGVNGVFGQRMFDISSRYVTNVKKIEKNLGEPLLKEDFDFDIDVLCIVHNETSVGVENPIKEIISKVKSANPDCIIIVDCVSSLGGADFDMDGWGIDVAISGSQKCLAAPPGLGLLAVRKGLSQRRFSRSYYFDLLECEKYIKKNQTPFTPSVPLFFALNEALAEIEEEGLDARINRHSRCAHMFREGSKEIGLELFVKDEYASKSVTSITHPNPGSYKNKMYEEGIVIEGAKGDLNIVRIGHLGNVTENEIERTLNIMKKIGVE